MKALFDADQDPVPAAISHSGHARQRVANTSELPPAAQRLTCTHSEQLPPDGMWGPADRPAIEFLFLGDRHIPRCSFYLAPPPPYLDDVPGEPYLTGCRVVDVELFLRSARRDAHLGHEHPLGQSALRVAKALQATFGRKARRGREALSGETLNAPRKPR